MKYSLYIPLVSLVYIVVLSIFYFSKKRLNSSENKIYSFMLISNITGLILEVLCTFAVQNMFGNEIIEMFILKSYLIYLLTWQILMTLYIYSITRKKQENIFNLFSNKFFSILMVFYIISSILLYILDLNKFNENGRFYSYGLGTQFLYILFGILIVSWVVMLIKNRKTVTKYKLIPVFSFMGIGLVVTLIQFSYPWMILITVAETMITFLMFHTIENPDLKMLNQIEYNQLMIEKLNNAKTDFLTNMSHEIRTPLNAISGLVQIIDGAETLPEAKENVPDVVDSVNRIDNLLKKIFKVSNFQVSKLELDVKEYNPKILLNELIQGHAYKIEKKPVQLIVSIDPSLPKILLGDNDKISSILDQLIDNAIKYTKEGTITFKVNSTNLNDVCGIIITVKDSGPGIKKDKIEKLFQIFDYERYTTLEGVGLGLAIAKKYADTIGGELLLENSIEGVGSEFTLRINQKIIDKTIDNTQTNYIIKGIYPVENTVQNQNIEIPTPIPDNQQPMAEVVTPTPQNVILQPVSQTSQLNEQLSSPNNPVSTIVTEEKTYPSYSNKKILIVDDENLNIKVATKVLSLYNIIPDSVKSGQECLDKINAGEKYDLILLDIMMPNMDGNQTLEELKKIPNFSIPVVSFTAGNPSTYETDRNKYLEKGFKEFLTKPIEKPALEVILQKFLSH